MRIFGPQIPLGQAPSQPEWFSIWSHMPGYQDLFTQWAWMTRDLAHHLARVMRGVRLYGDHQQYRLVGPVGDWKWYAVQGTGGFATWWAATHVGWLYTGGSGFMAINGALQGISGDTTVLRDTKMRVIT